MRAPLHLEGRDIDGLSMQYAWGTLQLIQFGFSSAYMVHTKFGES